MKKAHANSKYHNILTKDFLIKEYIVNKKSCSQIAKETGSHRTAIWRYLKIHGIKTRTNSEGRFKFTDILTKDFLYQEYTINKKSISQIAKKVGCSGTIIRNRLIQYNIRIRNHIESGQCQITKYSKTLTKKFLIKEYITNKKTIKQIAKEVGGSYTIVLNYLIKHGISRRTLSEAYKLLNRMGQNHPCYIKDLIRKYPLKFNKILKASIRKRDNHQCQICGKSTKNNGRKLDIHHIDYNKNNLNPVNLISLCKKCHMKTNGNRNIYIEFFGMLTGAINEK